MKLKILLMIAVVILIVPAFGENPKDCFDSWKDTYYNQTDDVKLTELFDNLTSDEMSKTDFKSLDYIYEKVFGKKSKNKMSKDFKKLDTNNNNKLSYKEFRDFFNPIYQFYLSNPTEYKFFLKTDLNNNGMITIDELEEISYVFTEDLFWDGYSVEEICQNEFERADDDANNRLNFTEFRKII